MSDFKRNPHIGVNEQQMFIRQMTNDYIAKVLSKPAGKWTAITRERCGRKNRREIFKRVCEGLSMMGIDIESSLETKRMSSSSSVNSYSPYMVRIKDTQNEKAQYDLSNLW